MVLCVSEVVERVRAVNLRFSFLPRVIVLGNTDLQRQSCNTIIFYSGNDRIRLIENRNVCKLERSYPDTLRY